jgi:LysR family glycine cleavage system transcriptional activator
MRKAHIPKIGELQAFTACATLGTTTLAAEELNLTQSAISRALSSLEDRLGVPLFHRARQRLSLAPAGYAFLPRARSLLAELEDAAMSVMAFGGDRSVIRIAVLPSFGRRWLMPRLARLHASLPSLSFDIQARLDPVNFTTETCDLAIMRKPHETGDVHSTVLLTEKLIVVAAPALIGSRNALSTEDFLCLPLLQQSTRPTLWLDWFASLDVDLRHVLRGARADHFDMVIEMACAGMGVAIVPEVLVRPELASGALQRASARSLATGEDYTLITPRRETRPEVANVITALRAAD